MTTTLTSVTNHFPSPQDGFTTTLSGSIGSAATTVGLNSVAGYTNGQTAVFIVDPSDPTKKQTFTGVIDTSGIQVTNVVWTAGTNVAHSAGATVVDYASATHVGMMSKGLLVEHDQDGGHGAITPSSVNTTTLTATSGTFTNLTITGTATSEGWSPLGNNPNTVTANGNRNYDLVFNSVDLTSTLSPGMRLKATRTVAAPSQCTDLEASSSQYYSRASAAPVNGMTFTDDFTVSAWVKLESYPGSGTHSSIISRYNGTSGWALDINDSGQIKLRAFNAAAANESTVTSYPSLPLNKWVHVAAQLDMSAFTATTTTSYVMFDGIDVLSTVSRSGTNPTALVQAGNLEIGTKNALSFFDGKIAQVAVYSAKIPQATMKASCNQTLSGSETSLISAYSFNNVITDLNTTNANNLTANGSAVATNADSPYAGGLTAGLLEYAYITSVTFSTNTTVSVSAPAQYLLPTTGGVSAMSYSTHLSPFGWINGDYNPYKFHVYRSAALTPAGADIIWDTKSYDLNNNVDTTTGIYTAPVAGYYQFNATVMVNSVAANLGYGVGIKKNGAYQVQNTAVMMYVGAYNHGMSISVTLQLAVGDKVSVVEAGVSSRPLQTGLASGFSGSLISKG